MNKPSIPVDVVYIVDVFVIMRVFLYRSSICSLSFRVHFLRFPLLPFVLCGCHNLEVKDNKFLVTTDRYLSAILLFLLQNLSLLPNIVAEAKQLETVRKRLGWIFSIVFWSSCFRFLLSSAFVGGT